MLKEHRLSSGCQSEMSTICQEFILGTSLLNNSKAITVRFLNNAKVCTWDRINPCTNTHWEADGQVSTLLKRTWHIDTDLNTSSKCLLVMSKANYIHNCIRRSMASKSRGVILLLSAGEASRICAQFQVDKKNLKRSREESPRWAEALRTWFARSNQGSHTSVAQWKGKVVLERIQR